MKKSIIFLGIVIISFIIQSTLSLAYVYDDFSSGTLDTSKWEIRQDVEGQPLMEEYWVDPVLENFHTQQTTAVDRRVYLVPKKIFKAGDTLEYDFNLISRSGTFAQMILLTGSDYYRFAGVDTSTGDLGEYHIILEFFEDRLEVSRFTPIGTFNQTFTLTNPNGEYELYIGSFSNGQVHIDYDNFVINGEAVAIWHLDEGEGTTASDSSGNGNDGTLYGGLDATGWTSDCIFGSCLKFDGVNDYIKVLNSASLNMGGNEITVEYWIKFSNGWYPESGGSWEDDQKIFDKGDAYNGVMIKNSGKHRFSIRPYAPPYTETNKDSWDADTWYYIVNVFDGTQYRIYVNGVLDKNETFIGSVSTSGYNLIIGAWTHEDKQFFNGTIDEFYIYKRAKTPEEIWENYQANAPEPVAEGSLECLKVSDSTTVNGRSSVDCPEGYNLTGGGCAAGNYIMESYPSDNGWRCRANSVTVTTFARCCKVVLPAPEPCPEPECNCTELTESVSELEEEVGDLQSRVETLEQGQGTVPPHNHTISEVIGLQGALDTMKELICTIIYDLLPKGLLQAAKFDTAYCQ